MFRRDPNSETHEREPDPGLVARARSLIESFYAAHVWNADLPRLSWTMRKVNRLLRIAYLSVRGTHEDDCFFRANALTYITVLSLVPLLAFVFAVSKGFGFYQNLRDGTIDPFLDRSFGSLVQQLPVDPTAGAGSHEMRQALEDMFKFVDRTNVSGLGALGLVVLLYTVIKLLSTIESSFNVIWGVRRARSLVRKVTDYTALVVVAPILLFAATAATTMLQNSGVVDSIVKSSSFGWLWSLLAMGAPLIALWLVFTFVYLAMPNARTRLSSALIGALVGGTTWQITLLVHIKFQLGLAHYNAIYASFAALPVFLIWIQLSWVAVLLGAEVCFAHQSADSWRPETGAIVLTQRQREEIALRVLVRVAGRLMRGETPWNAGELSRELSIALRPIESVLQDLVAARVLATGRGPDADVYLLARDLDGLDVRTVLELLRGSGYAVDRPQANDTRALSSLAGLDADLALSRHNHGLRDLAEDESVRAQAGIRGALPPFDPRPASREQAI